jgi:hypothetical protein
VLQRKRSIVAGTTASLRTRTILGMVPGWKPVLLSLIRVLLSVVSFVVAVALLSGAVLLRDVCLGPPHSDGLLKTFCYGGIMMLWFGWKGLMLALPLILFFTDLRAWRFWALLALGTTLGPVYLYLLLSWGSPWRYRFSIVTLLISVSVSGLTALLYLLILRRVQPLQQA